MCGETVYSILCSVHTVYTGIHSPVRLEQVDDVRDVPVDLALVRARLEAGRVCVRARARVSRASACGQTERAAPSTQANSVTQIGFPYVFQ
jgi:hypothetical protein